MQLLLSFLVCSFGLLLLVKFGFVLSLNFSQTKKLPIADEIAAALSLLDIVALLLTNSQG